MTSYIPVFDNPRSCLTTENVTLAFGDGYISEYLRDSDIYLTHPVHPVDPVGNFVFVLAFFGFKGMDPAIKSQDDCLKKLLVPR